MWRTLPMVVGLAVGLGGCDEPERLGGGLVLGTIDAYRLCDVDAVSVRLHATWQACLDTEPGCEIPEPRLTEGDSLSCPATSATYDLGVELAVPGRYRVEVVTTPTAGPRQVECFVAPQTGETVVDLPADRLQTASPLVLDEHGPCP